MNIIGNKIKELRLQKDMTQEKLADLLKVSYQTVSKWECGTTCPDLSLIVPIARLFGVTTDELLGVTNGDARRAEFDAAYENSWQKDIFEMYETAKAAVAEFPEDMKYLGWLAWYEYDIGVARKSNDALSKAERYFKTVIDNATSDQMRFEAICGAVETLKGLGHLDEAKEYVNLLPEKQIITKDELLASCLEGEEQLTAKRKVVCEKFRDLLESISSIYKTASPDSPYLRGILDSEENLIKAAVPDENFAGLHNGLCDIYKIRAKCDVTDGNYDTAIRNLKIAKSHNLEARKLFEARRVTFTCPLFEGYTLDFSTTEMDVIDRYVESWNRGLGKPIFDPIRERDDFKELLN